MNQFLDLVNHVIDHQKDDTLLFSFSGGKDSLAGLLRCLDSGRFKKKILYYMYIVDGMSWVDRHLDYIEKTLKLEILRVPSPQVLRMKQDAIFAPPVRIAASHKSILDHWPYFCYSYEELNQFLKEDAGVPNTVMAAVGVKACDSALRNMAMKKSGAVNYKAQKWFPAIDLNNKAAAEIIASHGIKLPEDYDMFGLSWDGLDYRFLKVIKDQKPEDYEKIKEVFPLCDLIIARHEHYHGNSIRKAKFNYQTYGLEILR